MTNWISVKDKEPPRDGTKFLVFTSLMREWEISHWYTNTGIRYEQIEGNIYRRIEYVSSDGWNSNHFTHWMYLPDPPALPEIE